MISDRESAIVQINHSYHMLEAQVEIRLISTFPNWYQNASGRDKQEVPPLLPKQVAITYYIIHNLNNIDTYRDVRKVSSC